MADDIAAKAKSVPVWVWALVGGVILIALLSHNSSAAPAVQTSSPGAADNSAASTALQQTQLAAMTQIGTQILDVAGTLDLARIQARTTEVQGNQTLAAIYESGRQQSALARAQNPPTINIVLPSQDTMSHAALATKRVRDSRMNLLGSVSGAIADGVHYAQGAL